MRQAEFQTESITRLTALGGLVRIRPSLGNDRFLRTPAIATPSSDDKIDFRDGS
jgi:hypothetical protein